VEGDADVLEVQEEIARTINGMRKTKIFFIENYLVVIKLSLS